MRLRITILSGVLLFSGMFAAPAYAGPWSAFIAWLTDLDPKTGGVGIEVPILCFPPTIDTAVPGQSQPVTASRLTCAPINPNAAAGKFRNRTVLKGSAAFLFGTLNEQGGTIFVVPALGVIEKQSEHFYAGVGAGFISVGGTLVGDVTRPLIQASATVAFPKARFGIRAEINVIPKGFPAGTFRAGGAATGTEVVPGFAFVLLR